MNCPAPTCKVIMKRMGETSPPDNPMVASGPQTSSLSDINIDLISSLPSQLLSPDHDPYR